MYKVDRSQLYTGASALDMSRFIDFSEGVPNPSGSAFLEALQVLPKEGEFTVTTEENRPDLVAYKIYGDVNLWWIFLAYNGLVRHDSLKSGVILAYPSKADLDSLKSRLINKREDYNLAEWFLSQ